MDRGATGTSRASEIACTRSESSPSSSHNELGTRRSTSSHEFGFPQYSELSSASPGHAIASETSKS